MAFEFDIETLKEQGMQLVDTAKKTALDLADKGKNQLELLNQQARLSKAQRQLGALVYSLHKAGEENEPLVQKYFDSIKEAEDAIEAIKAQMSPADVAEAEAEAETETAEPEAAADAEPEADIEEEPIAPRGETKTCPVCQAEIDADALFCNHCGAQL